MLKKGQYMKKVLAIVMARGGSKGLPNKNILNLAGIPLVEHTIKWISQYPLDQNKYKMDIVVSTDIASVEEICAKYPGVKYYKRADYLSADNTRGEAVIYDVCKNTAEEYDYVIILLGNIPVRHNHLLAQSLDILDSENETDCVITFKPVEKYNPSWMTEVTEGYLPDTWVEGGYRRQDLKQQMIHDGHTAVFRYKYHMDFVEKNGWNYRGKMYEFLGNKIRPIVHKETIIDIDVKDDFLYAQYYFDTHV